MHLHNVGQLFDLVVAYPYEHLKYGIVCKTNDIIEMICDLEKCELKYCINGIEYDKAYDIKQAKYRAFIDL